MLLERLVRQIRERIMALEVELGMGNCASHAEYLRACGEIAGLKAAIREIQDLRDGHEED